MQDNWLQHWNYRYAGTEYAFGTEPNNFLKQQLLKLTAGDILFAAEGEGRNAVFAAQHGWNVSAFDISAEGAKKAHRLAMENQVTIDYKVGELPELNYGPNQFDAIALVYAHFPAEIKSQYHQILCTFVKENGVVIFEAFSKKHIEYRLANDKIGGPRDVASLFSIDEIKTDFKQFETVELEEREVELSEGLYHNGKGSVIRFVGRKL